MFKKKNNNTKIEVKKINISTFSKSQQIQKVSKSYNTDWIPIKLTSMNIS